ncbi:hypothetical protein [Ulvibacterium sp.]|uniref:nSTAND3 domain-containing NTPase n=1 Tax=Ulvibacterium sp. TaxID=2665914 RepID=UPI003CC6767B
MKYNLDDLHWQEFEVFCFKVLQIMVSNGVQFIDGGADKGRDIVYTGTSVQYNPSWRGDWLFQVKHKSKNLETSKLLQKLTFDLKKELKKVFVDNELKYHNYVLVTNKTINGSLYDELQGIFNDFVDENNISCKNFSIISYHHIESCVEKNDSLKWSYPNIISHPDFKKLMMDVANRGLKVRNKGWLNGLAKQRDKFVYTRFFQSANSKLKKYPAIILSGPPKSGKTFNAEILALNYYLFNDFQPLVIDRPEEIENSFDEKRKQIFICDDSFGKYSLAHKAEDWFDKLERIFNLADESHLFIFTSREYIFRAFVNQGNDEARQLLEKIIVESHGYDNQEKLAILQRYTNLSPLSGYEKVSILSNEDDLIKNKNFSPETVRAFFSNIDQREEGESVLKQFRDHLAQPDAYLSVVFLSLSPVKQAALLSVLCSLTNDENNIHKSFHSICKDLGLSKITSIKLEFDELDDSILRIFRSDIVEQIQFYHPSMQEFLIGKLVSEIAGSFREVVLKNTNTEILNFSQVRAEGNSMFNEKKESLIKLQKEDVENISNGLYRLIDNRSVKILDIIDIIKWFCSKYHSLELKIYDQPMFSTLKKILECIFAKIFSKDFFFYHQSDSTQNWANMLFNMNAAITTYNFQIEQFNFEYPKALLKAKTDEENYWILVFRVLRFSSDDFIIENIGRKWLNDFYVDLKESIYELGVELFSYDFPDFKEHKKRLLVDKKAVKRQHKPNSTWYPRFLKVKKRIDVLKEVKGTGIGNKILDPLTISYNEINQIRDYAKNRHRFNIEKGWWNEDTL